jgi:Spy/CpxP family protein refolding chaperone
MKKWFILTAVVVAVSLATVAMAAPGPGGGREGRDGPGIGGGRGHGPGPGMMLQRVLENEALAKKVGLTDEQIATLKSSLLETQKQMIKLRAESELAELEVRRLMGEDKIDRAAVMKAIDAASAAHTAVRKAGVEERLKVRETIGQETLDKIREQAADRMGKRGGQDGDRRPGRGQRGDDDQAGPKGGKGKGDGKDKSPCLDAGRNAAARAVGSNP